MNNQELNESVDALDLIKEELDAKFDSILKNYKYKSGLLKGDAYTRYCRQTERMTKDFEYAKRYGYFPPSLHGMMVMNPPRGTVFTLTKPGTVLNLTENFNFQFPVPYKPSWIRRKLIEVLFGCRWID